MPTVRQLNANADAPLRARRTSPEDAVTEPKSSIMDSKGKSMLSVVLEPTYAETLPSPTQA
jgi:hypothetical protein